MRLIDAYADQAASDVLYRLLAERPIESCISHRELPDMAEHERFIKSRPFRYWYLLQVDVHYIGALECTDRNEIGVSLLREYWRQKFAREALELFMAAHEPLPAIPAIRNGHWLANIGIRNNGSKRFFASLGFKPLQETIVYDPG